MVDAIGFKRQKASITLIKVLPFSDLSIEELLSLLQDTFHLTLSDAIKTTAHIKEVPRQTVYKMVHHDEGQED